MIEMLGDVVAPLGPVVTEMITEATSPSSSATTFLPRIPNVLFLRALGVRVAQRTTMSLDVMSNEVFVKEIFGVTKVALELLEPLLIRLFVPLPIRFLSEGLLARCAEVLLRGIRTPRPLLAGYTCFVVVLVRHTRARCRAFPRWQWIGSFDRTGSVRRKRRRSTSQGTFGLRKVMSSRQIGDIGPGRIGRRGRGPVLQLQEDAIIRRP